MSLTFENVSVQHSYKTLDFSLNITLLDGVICNIYGPNGIGKSSLLKAIAMLGSYEGRILYNNFDVKRHKGEYIDLVEYIADNYRFFNQLTLRQNIELYASLCNKSMLVDAAIYGLGLSKKQYTKTGELSYGYKQRLNLSKLLIKNSMVLLLDEPFAHLDKQSQALIWEIIRVRASLGAIVIIASHQAIDDTLNINLENLCK